MVEHPHGWWSLLPPVVAIVLAIATRRVVLSLLLGVFAGALVLAKGNPFVAVATTASEHLWPALADEDKLHVFAFTTLMGVMVGIISRAAGMQGLVNVLTPLARSRRGGQLTTWALGLFVFFDDYANTLLLGNTLRPLTDRLKISREKLAYLVDSTAAPVSGLALVSTWVAGEIGYIQDGLDKLPPEVGWSALGLFLQSIPYRFYVLWALAMVPLVALLRRDFGPMWRAERKAWQEGGLEHNDTDVTLVSSPTDPEPGTPARWYNAVIPIGVTVGVILAMMYQSGRSAFPAAADPSAMEVFGEADTYGSLLWGALAGAVTAALMVRMQGLLDTRQLKASAAAGGLMMAPALVILWLASALSTMTGNQPSAEDAGRAEAAQVRVEAEVVATWKATGELRPALARLAKAPRYADTVVRSLVDAGADIEELGLELKRLGVPETLLVSWLRRAGVTGERLQRVEEALRGQADSSPDVAAVTTWKVNPYPYSTYRLYTGAYLTGLLKDRLPFVWFPTVIFVLSSAISFATGTSWGTMGIVMPLAVPLVYQVGLSEGVTAGSEHPIVLSVIGGVLAGAIFGDHCSPISDTTILSSQASGCDHLAHVWTQMPYAVSVGILSVVIGTLPVAWGVSVWLLLPLGVAAIIGLLLTIGRDASG